MEDHLAALLAQSGREWHRISTGFTLNCPFHPEHTPSLYIYLESQRYYCYGCQHKGGLVGLVAQLFFAGEENAYAKAAALLWGARLPAPLPQRPRPRVLQPPERAALGTALAVWRESFWSPVGEPAQRYLLSRFPQDAPRLAQLARDTGLGYATRHGSQVIRDQLSPYPDVSAWLLRIGVERIDRSGERVPRGLARLVIPEVRGGESTFYQARAVFPNPYPYLSPPGPKRLLGVETLCQHLPLVLVEGPMDYLAVRLAGFPCLCLLGGSTSDPLSPLLRGKIVIDALDADAGGDQARQHLAPFLTQAQEVRRLALPPGSDPAEVAALEGSRILRVLLEEATLSEPPHGAEPPLPLDPPL